jgi:Fe2+ transport system protein B
VFLSLLSVGFLASCLLAGEQGDFLIELPPMRVPQISNIVVKTLARVEWYLREAVPLFMLGTVILFGLAELGLLGLLEKAGEPVVGGVLGLPPQATGAFLIGFLRRDYGAAGLFRLFTSGSITPIQALVSLITITLFVPCIANFLVIVKEQGTKVALAGNIREEKMKKCPLCSFRFTSREQSCLPVCPLSSGCMSVCCPRCGYHFVDEERSWVIRGLRQLLQKVRSRP